MTPAQDIARLLQDEGHGVVATDIFVGTEPDAPSNCTTVYDLPGGEVDTDEADVFSPTFQVRTRNLSYVSGYTLLSAMRDTLSSKLQYLGASGKRYYSFHTTVDVAPLARDDNDRYIFVASFRTIYQE